MHCHVCGNAWDAAAEIADPTLPCPMPHLAACRINMITVDRRLIIPIIDHNGDPTIIPVATWPWRLVALNVAVVTIKMSIVVKFVAVCACTKCVVVGIIIMGIRKS